MFRVLVCGGRNYWDREKVDAALSALRAEKGPLHVIQGGAKGADRLAALWCYAKASGGTVMMSQVPADWATHGKRAGAIRNQKMLDDYQPQLVVAFPGGPGTADMVRRARAAGVEVREISK